MWKNLNRSRYPIVFCNYFWGSPYTGADSDASMGAMCSGASLMENTARMCVAIVDRYELGMLKTQCGRFAVESGLEDDPVIIAFNTALATATEIMDSPGDYTHAQFRQAIENLQAAHQAAQDYVDYMTDVPKVFNNIEGDTYNLSGQKVSGKLQKGIYIIGGRKVLIK